MTIPTILKYFQPQVYLAMLMVSCVFDIIRSGCTLAEKLDFERFGDTQLVKFRNATRLFS